MSGPGDRDEGVLVCVVTRDICLVLMVIMMMLKEDS